MEHHGIHRIPSVEFELERPHLMPYRGVPTIPSPKLLPHHVRKDNVITYKGNYYSVPTGTYQGHRTQVYLEEKELRSVRPWEPLDRSVTIGTTRRSDGKTYRAVTVTPASGAGTPYTITGNSRPTHEVGRAWDGPGDSRSDGVNSYAVGVEWEYVDSGYGIVKLTEYVSPTQMKGVVISTIPQSIVGTAPSPANQWTLSGDASAVTFPIAGASSPSQSDYRVTINGVPVQSNPYYEPTTGGSGTGGGALPGRGGETTNPYGQIEP